jgi:CheY-like chemotaxis protein
MSGPFTPRRFLVVDDNPDSRFLLVKTLVRKFPTAEIAEAQTADLALSLALTGPMVIITHRAADMDGIELVKRLREQNSRTPILMVSSIERTPAALAAGANRFMLYDEWLRTGSIVDEMLSPGAELAH